MRPIVMVVVLCFAGVVLAQAVPPLDSTAVTGVDRSLDASACDGASQSLAARALAEIEGESDGAGGIGPRRLPAPLIRALMGLANADPASRVTTLTDALASPEGLAALGAQCGDPSSLARRVARMSTTDRVREVWRSCRLDSAGLVRPRRGLAAADGFVQVVAAVIGHLTRASGRLEPVEVRLLQTMVSGSAPRCGTATPTPSDETPGWLRDAPPPSRREEDDRRYQIEP